MPTLIDTLTTRLNALQAEVDAATAALPALATSRDNAQAALQPARQAQLDAELAVQRLRDQLGQLELPAEGGPLGTALQTARITRNQARAALLAAEEALLRAEVELAQRRASLDEGTRRLQALRTQLATLQAPHAARQALLGRLAGARLAVQDQAAARLAAEGAAARTQLLLDLPATLLDRLAERHAHLAQLQARLEATQTELAALQAGLDGDAAQRQAQAALRAAEATGAALADAAALPTATAVLARLAARPARLSANERAALAATPAATADLSTRADAAAAQQAYDARRLDLALKDGERRRIHLDLLLKNPADFPPAAGARKTAYDDAQTAANNAQTAFDTANTAFGAKHRKAMDDWQAGLSEALAADVQAYLDARAALQALDGANPATVRAAIRDAESAAAAAWLASDAALRKGQAAAHELRAVSAWLQGDPGSGGRRLSLGLRGAP
jgi:hypothetical protein